MHRNRTLRYSLLRGRYAICKLDSGLPIPAWASEKLGLVSITRNPDELSIVCAESSIPAEVHASRGWVCVKLQGPFAFSETGVLSAFINPLAERGIGIFAVSTFDTDYVLIQENEWLRASEVLRAAGHEEFSS